MTKADGDDYTPILPGLDVPNRLEPALLSALRTTFAALDADGLLEPRHAALMQLCTELAESVANAKVSRRATAVALAARELRETLALLPEPAVSEDDGWKGLEDALRAAARGHATESGTPD